MNHKIQITVYAHTSKEAKHEAGKKAGLTEGALDLFVYAASEVKLELDVDFATGAATIAAVNGITIKAPSVWRP